MKKQITSLGSWKREITDEHENEEESEDYQRDFGDRSPNRGSDLVSNSLNQVTTERERERESQLELTLHDYYLTAITDGNNDEVVTSILNLVTKSEEVLKPLKEIEAIISGNDAIKAASLLFLLKHRLIWAGAMRKIFPNLTAQQVIERFLGEEKRGFCFEVKDGDERFRREKRKLEIKIERQANSGRYQVKRVRWFGITERGLKTAKRFKQNLEALLTEDVRKKINDPNLSFLHHTHKEHEYVELQKQRTENKELVPIREEICRLNGMGLNEVNKRLQKESERTGERRLAIAKRWLEDLQELSKKASML